MLATLQVIILNVMRRAQKQKKMPEMEWLGMTTICTSTHQNWLKTHLLRKRVGRQATSFSFAMISLPRDTVSY